MRSLQNQSSYDTDSEAYAHKVYAGVLGKMIGVYLGRPIEGMAYRDILKELGPIRDYVHVKRKRPLVIPDDDLTGTFTFVRALEDHHATPDTLTPEQVASTWLNYVVENKTIFWWGGLGLSTEHTAFLRLVDGVAPPLSGSAELNSKVVAEQIGAQIFIDGWAMVTPGDPRRAADLARRAACVSHDGEAIYGAQVIAAMESLAFVESDLNVLLDTAVGLIPADSIIARMIADLRAFHAGCSDDWERAFVEVLEAHYGYDKYAGNCHVVPNHGVVILALLYARDDFARALMIANTCGWDTDCNAANVGCLMGIKNGLAGIGRAIDEETAPDWRGPVADRLLLPTSDGGECITDAANETVRLVNLGRSGQGRPAWLPKEGARFHFALPGSVQGFVADEAHDCAPTRLSNIDGRLAVAFGPLAGGRVVRAMTATYAPPHFADGSYGMTAAPTLWPGQVVRATVHGDADAALRVRLCVRVTAGDTPRLIYGPETALSPGATWTTEWTVPPTDGWPIEQVGLQLSGEGGVAYLDRLTWSGAPDITLGGPPAAAAARRQWVEAVNVFNSVPGFGGGPPTQAFLAVQNRGVGMAITGTRDWDDYEVSATLTPHLAIATGLAARVRGLRRYYALLLRTPGRAALVRVHDEERTLADAPFDWDWNDDPHALQLRVQGARVTGTVDGVRLFDLVDPDPLPSGGIAIVVEAGRVASTAVRVRPVTE